MAKRKRVEHDTYTAPNGKILDLKNPWFRVSGSSLTYEFKRYVEVGALKWVEAWCPKYGWRAFYVGKKPYSVLGIMVRPYRITPKRPPRTKATLHQTKLKKKRAKKT